MVKRFKPRFHINNFLFGAVNVVKNADAYRYKYKGYVIGFDARSEFPIPDCNVGKNVIIFGADPSSSVHIDNKNKDILVHGKGTTQRLDNTTLALEIKYPISFTESEKRFVLTLH